MTKEDQKLEASYGQQELINGQLFPLHIIYDISAKNPIKVEMNYSRIILDKPLSIPFFYNELPQASKQTVKPRWHLAYKNRRMKTGSCGEVFLAWDGDISICWRQTTKYPDSLVEVELHCAARVL